ncbi:MAG: hypothetical protein V7784_15030 [Oceanospirillaceae bacterium]
MYQAKILSRIRLGATLIATLIMTGCAANMAANGQNGPELSLISQEKSRREVERHLGLPINILNLKGGQYIATYDVHAKTEPSLARAMGHGALDVVTLGLWEVIGGPAEMYHGRRVIVSARYDKANQLLTLQSRPKGLF